MTPQLMAVLGFYSVFTPAFFMWAFHHARPTWRIDPRVPRVIADEIPRGEWQ